MNELGHYMKDTGDTGEGKGVSPITDVNTFTKSMTASKTGEFFYTNKDNQTFFAIGKKTEKIVTAMYMVTDLFEEEEPLRTQLRLMGVSLVRDIFSCMGSDSSQRTRVLTQGMITLETMVSLIHMMESLRFISEMNGSILREEMVKLEGLLERELQFLHDSPLVPKDVFHTRREPLGKEALMLSPSFFDVPLLEQLSKEKEEQKNKVNYKGQDIGHVLYNKDVLLNTRKNDLEIPVSSPAKEASPKIYPSKTISFQKDKAQSQTIRLRQIIAVFDAGREYSIKDISERFPQVSEKTIQRDLLQLSEEGRVLKSGKKRWSKYRLAISNEKALGASLDIPPQLPEEGSQEIPPPFSA